MIKRSIMIITMLFIIIALFNEYKNIILLNNNNNKNESLKYKNKSTRK